jgi:alpha-glucuronidase
VYLAPMWKRVLDFDLRAENRSTPVKEIIAGKAFHRKLGGMVGVACVGQDAWLGSPLALANLYAFGRLAWNSNLTSEQIAEEWTKQTIADDPQVVTTVTKMLMQSWPAYVDYTGPLGMQTLTYLTGSHYGPNIESSENNGWGQWHRADHNGWVWTAPSPREPVSSGNIGLKWRRFTRTPPPRLTICSHSSITCHIRGSCMMERP